MVGRGENFVGQNADDRRRHALPRNGSRLLTRLAKCARVPETGTVAQSQRRRTQIPHSLLSSELVREAGLTERCRPSRVGRAD